MTDDSSLVGPTGQVVCGPTGPGAPFDFRQDPKYVAAHRFFRGRECNWPKTLKEAWHVEYDPDANLESTYRGIWVDTEKQGPDGIYPICQSNIASVCEPVSLGYVTELPIHIDRENGVDSYSLPGALRVSKDKWIDGVWLPDGFSPSVMPGKVPINGAEFCFKYLESSFSWHLIKPYDMPDDLRLEIALGMLYSKGHDFIPMINVLSPVKVIMCNNCHILAAAYKEAPFSLWYSALEVVTPRPWDSAAGPRGGRYYYPKFPSCLEEQERQKNSVKPEDAV